MKELFNTRLPGGELPGIQLCIFPHLKEFLIIDMRDTAPNVRLLNTDEIFTDDFYRAVEEEFSQAVREETEFPFAQLINLPLRLEEVVREKALTFILDRLGVTLATEQVPSVIVFIVSGSALKAKPDLVLDGLKNLLRNQYGIPAAGEWDEVLSGLIAEENALLQHLHQHELSEALMDDSPDYFTLWENRN